MNETIVAVDPGWCSGMIEKIRRLDQRCNFHPFFNPSDEPLLASTVTEASKDITRETEHAQSMPSIPTTHIDESISSSKYSPFNSLKEDDSNSDQESQEEDFDDVADIMDKIRITTPGTTSQGSYASKNFEYFNSTKEASAKILEALRDETSYMIGLYGKKGSGKTALVTAEIARYKEIFDKVIFVTVPGKIHVDMQKLRDRIALKLKLNFRANASNLDRVIKIKWTLEKKKKVLVIFDDVSEMFDPRDIGIPDPSEQCKLLWITHDKRNLTMMRCHPLIPLRPLSDDDAWLFLQQYSGIDDDYYDSTHGGLCTVAHAVALRCKGLPYVIEDIVSCLENKNTTDDTMLKEYWTETLDCLKHVSASYQIFISFRGIDTRDGFTEFLYDALVQAGFKVFIDKEIRSGDQVSEALINVIERSRCSIVVLSENYAQSSWCLDELLKIMECREKIKQLVYPIFYKVEPSTVRYVQGTYKEAMAKKVERFGKEKVQEWTSALFKIASLSGNHHPSGSHKTFINEVVEYVKDNKHRLHIL